MKNPTLSIIIPCKNEGSNIIACLDSIKNQAIFPKNELEIIISDSSTDDTRQIIYDYKGLDIKIIDGGLPSKARNAGAKKALGEQLLFLDADIRILNPYTLMECSHELKNLNLHLITCRLTSNSFGGWIMYNMTWLFQLLFKKKSPFCVGSFMFFDKDTFFSLGGFNEKIHFAEDYYLSKKIQTEKFQIKQYPLLTGDRRFKKMGYFWMIKNFIKCYLNRNNEEFFTKDWSVYWK